MRAAERADAVGKAVDTLVAEVEAGHSARLAAYLAAMGRFHRYSLGNVLLIGMQCPQATHVAGFRAWQRLGRRVRNGERGIRIMAPIVRRPKVDEDDSKRVVAFKTVCVFDVSQTDGKPLPELGRVVGDAGEFVERSKVLVGDHGIELQYANLAAHVDGWSSGGRIGIREGLASAEEFSVLVHEFAHELLHRGETDRGILALDHLADDLILLLRDVELVQPADDLDFLPVGLVDLGDEFADQRVGVQQVDPHLSADGTVVSIYARALFETGDSDNAIRQQERALKLAIGPGQTAEMASALRRFRAADGDPTVPAVQSQAANPDTGGSRGLSQVRAIGDLQHLHDLLRLNYAGYDDLEWRLRCDGSSWSQRTDRFVDELRSRPNWPAGDFYALVRRYLEPVQDTHFWTQGPASLLGLFKPPVDRYVTPFTPYFTDLRLRADGDGFRVISAPKELGHVDGLELRAVGVVSNHRAALAQPYLFPTVSVLGEDEEFLLGCFSDRPSPAPLELEFHGTGNPPVSVTLSLHRSQATVGSFVMPSWTLRRPPQVAYPTLTVRTMDRQILAGLPETAGPLSKEPVIVIDLRGNDGGSDEPAMNWCAGFSKQRYRFGPGADLQRGVAEGRDRWTCGFGGSWDETRMGVNAAKQPYAGQLFILIDKGTASSGETFAAFASQIPGAILLGENSAGCTLYGNCDIQEKLPASGITIRFGRTKFLDGAVRPTREGVGFFPDYWLDELDPYAAIQRLLTSRKEKAKPTDVHQGNR